MASLYAKRQTARKRTMRRNRSYSTIVATVTPTHINYVSQWHTRRKGWYNTFFHPLQKRKKTRFALLHLAKTLPWKFFFVFIATNANISLSNSKFRIQIRISTKFRDEKWNFKFEIIRNFEFQNCDFDFDFEFRLSNLNESFVDAKRTPMNTEI